MSKFYEARKILIKFSQADARVGKFEEYARELCQLLEPKADELGESEVEWIQEQMLYEKECRKLGKELPLPSGKARDFVLRKPKADESISPPIDCLKECTKSSGCGLFINPVGCGEFQPKPKAEGKPQTEKELREKIRDIIANAWGYSPLEFEATNQVMALIKGACWLKGDQELPKNPYVLNADTSSYYKVCRWEGYNQAVADMAGFKPCKEWTDD